MMMQAQQTQRMRQQMMVQMGAARASEAQALQARAAQLKSNASRLWPQASRKKKPGWPSEDDASSSVLAKN